MIEIRPKPRSRAHARVDAQGRLLCDVCGRVADALHCDGRRWYAACPRHEPGYWWIRLADWYRDPFPRLVHLREKHHPNGETWSDSLLRWLGYAGVRALHIAARAGQVRRHE